MTKIVDATCENGVVTVDDFEATEAVILSKGIGESSGLALIDKEKIVYVTSSATDIELTIEKLVNAITKIGVILTSIGAGMTGPTTAPPPTIAADVADLNAIGTELTTLKGQLK